MHTVLKARQVRCCKLAHKYKITENAIWNQEVNHTNV